MSIILNTNEEATIKAFVQKDKQERCLTFLNDPKTRIKFTNELGHFKWLDKKFSQPITSAVAHTVEQRTAFLRSKGAGAIVWAISEDQALDGKEHNLDDALGLIWGQGMGTFLSCVPGKLCYFENEDGAWLLQR